MKRINAQNMTWIDTVELDALRAELEKEKARLEYFFPRGTDYPPMRGLEKSYSGNEQHVGLVGWRDYDLEVEGSGATPRDAIDAAIQAASEMKERP